MSTKGPEGEGPDKLPVPPTEQKPAEEAEKKPVGKIALKKKASRPPWAVDPVTEVGPEGLRPVEPDEKTPPK